MGHFSAGSKNEGNIELANSDKNVKTTNAKAADRSSPFHHRMISKFKTFDFNLPFSLPQKCFSWTSLAEKGEEFLSNVVYGRSQAATL
jgi:hypothetical protein